MQGMRRDLLQAWRKEHFRGRRALFALWAVLLGAVIYKFASYTLIAINVWDYIGNDYLCFYEASRDLWLGNPIYPETIDPDTLADRDPEIRHRFWGGYVYPAVYAVLLWPFSWLPLFWSRKLFVLFTIVVYAWIFRDVLRTYLSRTGPWAMLVCFVLWFWWGPALQTIRMAQSNTVVLVLLYASWKCARRESPLMSGVFLGLAATVKLTPLAIFPFLLVRKQWRILVAANTSFFITLLICFPSVNWNYFRYLFLAGARAVQLPAQASIPAKLDQLLSEAVITSEGESGAGRFLVLGLSALLYLGALSISWRNRERWPLPDLLLYSIGVMPLFAAKQAHHYMVSVLPSFIILTGMLNRRLFFTEGRVSVAALVGILLWLPIPYHLRSVNVAWTAIEPLTSIRYQDLLLPSQGIWFFVLWPLLYGPAIAQSRLEGDRTTCQKK